MEDGASEGMLKLDTDKMIAKKEGPIGWMIYNNPERRNAISLEMQESIPTILENFAADDDIRVVVARGAGEKAFISGADISEFGTKRTTREAREHFDRIAGLSAAAYLNLEKPLIAMIHGFCMGGGLATALMTDIRIASEDAQLGIPAARLGVGYPFAAVRGLVALVGPANANEILISGRKFSASEALQMGLVNRVVPSDELEATVRELASTIAQNAPLSMKAAKFAIRQAITDPNHRDLDTCHRLIEDCFLSQDFKEGQLAFMAKRKPDFKGF